jgi:hypothetical protein
VKVQYFPACDSMKAPLGITLYITAKRPSPYVPVSENSASWGKP